LFEHSVCLVTLSAVCRTHTAHARIRA